MAFCLAAAGCTSVEGPSEVTARAESAPRPSTGHRSQRPTQRDDGSGFPDGWTPERMDWSSCDVADGAQCARLTVPLDWDDPSGPTVDLTLARTTATGRRIGSLLTNPGGPGASGIEFLGYAPFAGEITDRFDVVTWDPRGVGASDALECGRGVDTFLELDPEPDDAAEQADLDAAAAAVAAECGERDGDLLPHVGTADVARDMEAIRRALGEEPLNYVGFSYGTQIGQAYADMFPDEIRTMVLDAVVDPALGYEQLLVEQAQAFDEAFDRSAEACAAAGPQACGVADLGAAYDQVMAILEQRPLRTAGRPVGPAELATGAVLTSYGPDGWMSLGPALADALDGDGSELRRLADSYRDFGGFTSYAAVVCVDTPPPRGAEAYAAFARRAAQAAPRFGASVANELLPCATWPAPPVGEARGITAPDAPPILVVGNTGDAATPYENAVTVADRLVSGVLVTADIDGHGGYGASGCVTRHVDDYLIRLELPGGDPRCT